MALPTPADLKTMDYAYRGQPFVYVPAKNGLALSTMDYAYQAQPFVPNPDASSSYRPKMTPMTPILMG